MAEMTDRDDGSTRVCWSTVESYLGERKQRVDLHRLDDRRWVATSPLHVTHEALKEEQESALDEALARHPGLAFRYVGSQRTDDGKALEAYIEMVGRYPDGLSATDGAGDVVALDEVGLTNADRRLVEYLAHAADRLEFELTGGGDAD